VLQTQARHVPNSPDPASRLATIVDEYRGHDNLGVLFDDELKKELDKLDRTKTRFVK